MAPKSSKSTKKSSDNRQPTIEIDPSSSLTSESFEKELKALAAKAQEETWGKWALEQTSAYLRSTVLISLIAVSANASQLALSPVYGSIPPTRWHSYVVGAACFTGWSSNLYLNRALKFKPQLLLPVIAIYIPTVQFFLFKLSELMTAKWGPLVTEILTLYPLMSLSVACIATDMEDVDLSLLPRWMADAAPGLGGYGLFKTAEVVSKSLIERYIGQTLINTRLGLEIILAASYSLFAPSKMMLYAIPALLHTAVLNPHVPTDAALTRLNGTLNSQGWAILERQESVTGYISVLENVKEGFRAMRCDHSLLGGEWVKVRDMPQFKGNKVAEPIYSVFTMLEAVRLVQVPEPVPDSKAHALTIGLGIGTTQSALIAHGIDTTVVEIDPVVHEYALKYFQLPSTHTAVIEDAVSYTTRLANDSTAQRFDYIVHDVFTGGAEPIALFTLEFLRSLHALLMPNGVIAINYAGDFALPPPRVVVNTIREVFPSCRIYREHPRNEDEFERQGRDFTNMVIFCTKNAAKPITFRKPTARDTLNSPARQRFLLPEHEVLESHFLAGEEEGILRNNDTQKLEKWHMESALGHWTVMRAVIPAHIWEQW